MKTATDKVLEEYHVNNLEELTKQWGVVADETALRPIADRILILEDEFKSRYDCTDCEGKGHNNEVCPYCLGTKLDRGKEENGYCRDCTVGAANNAVGRTLGYVPCSTCGGRGGTIIIQDEAKSRPTTGKVIAIGSEVTEYSVGTHVLYSNYTGTAFTMHKMNLRVMRQHDVYCEVKSLNKDKTNLVPEVSEKSTADPDNIGEV